MISIITPTYNESKNIERLIEEISKAMKDQDYEIIVADDNSPDGTAKIASKLSKKYPVRVLIRKKNKGLSPAVCDGFKIAKGNIMGVIDADLSHPPEIIPKLVGFMKEKSADIVVASRLVKGGGTEDWPNSRKLTSYIATTLAKPVTSVKDPMSGFFFIKRDVIKGVKLKAKGYKILLEILVKGDYKKVVEYPFTFRDRTAGESKLNIKTNLQYLEQLFNLYCYSILRPREFKMIKKFSKYTIIGMVWSIINIFLPVFFIDYLKFSTLIGTFIAVILVFFGKYYTSLMCSLIKPQFVKYTSITIIFSILNILLMWAFVDLMGIKTIISSAVIVVSLFIFRFVLFEKTGLIKDV